MTTGKNSNPTYPSQPRQEGTPVADADIPRTADAATPVEPSGANAVDESTDERAVSVWTTAQTSPAAQRAGRYTPESTAHPAKMLPAVAAHAIAHYTQPGDLVLDPMCGIGTTLVEALHLGRRAVGVEYEPHWVDVTRANLELAREAGIEHDAQVFPGDARQLAGLLPPQYVGQVALVVTSPPYGPSTHGQVALAPGQGVQKYHHRYGNTLDRGNLANIGHHRLLAGFTRILASTAAFLRPGGHVAITIRPWREHAELIDLPAQILACGQRAGLIPVERCVALLARAGDGDLVARGSFFQRDFIRKQRDAGLPLHLIAHEDVLVFRTPQNRRSSAIAMQRRDSRGFVSGRARHAGNPRVGSGVSESWAA
jgi:tRNA1(Val) A37 N6-methylase TrmN6